MKQMKIPVTPGILQPRAKPQWDIPHKIPEPEIVNRVTVVSQVPVVNPVMEGKK